MATVTLPLPDELKSYLDKEAAAHGHADVGGYVRALIEKERRRLELRSLVLEGLESPVGRSVDEAYMEALRDRVRQRYQSCGARFCRGFGPSPPPYPPTACKRLAEICT